MTPGCVASEGWLLVGGTQPKAVASEGWLTNPVLAVWQGGPGERRRKMKPHEDPWKRHIFRDDDEVLRILCTIWGEIL